MLLLDQFGLYFMWIYALGSSASYGSRDKKCWVFLSMLEMHYKQCDTRWIHPLIILLCDYQCCKTVRRDWLRFSPCLIFGERKWLILLLTNNPKPTWQGSLFCFALLTEIWLNSIKFWWNLSTFLFEWSKICREMKTIDLN